MNINIPYKCIHNEKLEDIFLVEKCNIPIKKCNIPKKVRQELINNNIITIHDYLMIVALGKIKIPGLAYAVNETIISCICNYLSTINEIEIDGFYHSSWDDWIMKYQNYHLTNINIPQESLCESKEEHYHKLLNSIIDHVSNCESNSTTIKTLLNWGFTVEDLVQDFNFSESDVKDCEEEMDDFDPVY